MPYGYPFRRGRTIKVTRYTENPRTQERKPDPDFDPETTGKHSRCAYDPGGTRENEDGSSYQQSPRVFGPYDADIRADDTIEIDGVDGTFEVDGPIERLRNDLTGSTPCSEIRLRRKEGAVR